MHIKKYKKKSCYHTDSRILVLVEVAGIEPASESRPTALSTSVVYSEILQQ